jgi:hypothetical protein
MKKKRKEIIYFNELQTINRFWIRLLLLFEVLFFSAIIYRQVFMGKLFGPWPVTNSGLVVLSLLLLSPTVILYLVKIKTTVTESEIRYKMLPPGLFSYHIQREQVKSISMNLGKDQTQKQKNGVTLSLKSGKILFLPSHDPQSLRDALQKMKAE